MDPITGAIDKTEELLGHSPHPAVVMLPLGAWTVSNISDALALATGNRRYDDVARVSMAIGLAGAAVAALTGLRDYGKIPKDRHPNHEIATTHGLGNAVAATLVTTSYILRERDHRAGHPPSLTSRLLSLAAGGLSMYTAWLGGKLVEELGEAVHPVMDRLSAEESSDDHPHGRERLSPDAPLGPHHEATRAGG